MVLQPDLLAMDMKIVTNQARDSPEGELKWPYTITSRICILAMKTPRIFRTFLKVVKHVQYFSENWVAVG